MGYEKSTTLKARHPERNEVKIQDLCRITPVFEIVERNKGTLKPEPANKVGVKRRKHLLRLSRTIRFCIVKPYFLNENLSRKSTRPL